MQKEARSCGPNYPCPENRSGLFQPHESNPPGVSVRCVGTALGCLRDPPRPYAGGANAHVLADAVHHRAHPPQIRIPAAAPGVIGVADDVAVVRRFAANFAFLRHAPPSIKPRFTGKSLTEFARPRIRIVTSALGIARYARNGQDALRRLCILWSRSAS